MKLDLKLALAVVVALVVTLGGCAPASSEPPPLFVGSLGRAPSDVGDAMTACKYAIKDALVAPSTARFPGPFSADFTQPHYVGGKWAWATRVDSQNAFGARLRGDFLCTIDGSGVVKVWQMD